MKSLITVLCGLILCFSYAGCSKKTFIFPYETMIPTIAPGSQIQLDYSVYKYSNPSRFDIVSFTPTLDPRHDKVEWILRVIGLPGERILIQNGKILVNDTPLSVPLSLRTIEFKQKSVLTGNSPRPGAIILGPDEYYLLADNPIAVTDSREIGPITRKQIRARMVVP